MGLGARPTVHGPRMAPPTPLDKGVMLRLISLELGRVVRGKI